ncbi:GTPase-associated protein 1-related protein [Streptomyces sp. NBC_01537]|uniref:GTPase-associated protein 1-related protein n=1 Tax=Streptomyces sp. NBC_01537 TaxID=2903896 RepID=UPI0038695EF5
MTFRQLHYTSAPPGPDGSGFRFTAVDPAVDPVLLRQAEPLLGYEPPRDAPSRPTADELTGFPVAFGFARLPDGTRMLSRTVYTGADYSGRYGNFHAHALLLPPGGTLPPRMFPVEAWESPDWQTVTPAGSAPPPLDSLRRGDRINRPALLSFARNRAERLAPFLSDVRRLFTAGTAPAPSLVMVESGAEEVALWVTVACTALPPRYADELTFTTYTRRPYLADQQIVGVLPDAEFGYASSGLNHQYRLHHCLGGESSPPQEADPWAAVAARILLAGRPELFVRVPADPPFEAGGLAALALSEGIALDSTGRAAAVNWALGHAGQRDVLFWQAFLDALLREGRPSGELPGLLAALGARWPAEVTDPLARALVRAAVTGGPVPDLRRTALTPQARLELGRELAPALDAALADPAAPADRGLALLGLAEELGVDLAGSPALTGLAARIADHLLAASSSPSSSPSARDVAATLSGSGPGPAELRGAVLDRLNDVAQTDDDPARAVPVLSELLPWLEQATPADYPHLRTVVAAGQHVAGLNDGLPLMNRLVRESGWYDGVADASLLRTAFRIAWPQRRPPTADARMLLAQITLAPLAESGLDRELAAAAIAAEPSDQDAPELARELLGGPPGPGGFPDARTRDALRLLVHAEDIRTGHAGSGFTAYAVALLDRARPVAENLELRLSGNIAARILSGFAPGGERPAGVAGVLLTSELEQLVRSGNEPMLAAYAQEAHGPVMLDRLRRDPRYPAACFISWNSFAGAGPVWDGIRLRLLDQILRPVIRKLPDADLSAVEGHLAGAGAHWPAEWRRWHRPGLVRRWGRHRGGGDPSGPWRDATPGTPGTGPGSTEGLEDH